MKNLSRKVDICILALLIQFCFGIYQVSSAQEEQAASQEPAVSELKSITAIEVKGNKSISANTVVSKMKSRIGSPYQDNIISDDLKRLYLLGFFSDVKIDTEDYKDGLKVIITVEERPLIEKIIFSGIKRITMTPEKLKEQLKSKEAQYLDYPSLAEDIRIMEKIYEKVGYSKVVIEHNVEISKETNKARVEFKVSEGSKIRIKDIFVQGNQAFSKGRILKLIKTKRAWTFNSGVLKEAVLKEDMERIKSFYRKNGFSDIEADYETKVHPKRASLLYITIKIQEGKKYLVGNITLQGNKDIQQKDILNKIKECVPGKVFSQEALKQDVSNIQSLYFDRGYISCQVQEATLVNPHTGRVDITYNIKENEVGYVAKIKIQGNVKTKDLVIRRELRIHPGDKFDGEKLRRSKERLQNLGFFEDVSYDTQDTEEPNKKDLVVDVKESKTGAFSFGGGYSTVEDLVGFIEIEQKNFDWKNFPYFTGAGQDLKLRATFGTVSSGFDLSFTEPWLFDYPVSFGFDAYKRSHDRESDVGYGYSQDVTGGDLRLGRELSEYSRADLTYRYDQIDITNITDTASADLKDEYGKNTIGSFTTAFTYDSRDNVFDPLKGDLFIGSLECAGGPFAGDKDFWKMFGRASHYFPLFNNSVIEIRARAGAADAYSNSLTLPIYERFFAGGAYTIRGYEERKIGPIDSASKDPLGGEALAVGNLEYTYPLFSFLRAALFYDTGNVWAKMSDFASGGFKSAAGLGFRIKTPIGPIMLDYGIPLNKAPDEENKSNGRFHFSASHGF
ncbi:MAG: outer membrane protein assembly factor BamA [Candidatus Omnitrophota bacterium]